MLEGVGFCYLIYFHMNAFFLHILSFVVVLSPLVLIHELGHYWVARLCDVKVESFSIGFGPILYEWTDRHGTYWRISLLLLGGYVRMLGDTDPASNALAGKARKKETSQDMHRTLASKSVWQKIAIAAAGPISNYVLAFFLFTGLFCTAGETLYESFVGPIVPQSLAEKSGLREGDHIVMLQGEQVKTFGDVTRILETVPLKSPLSAVIDRNGHTLILSIKSDQDSSGESWLGNVGITPHPKHHIQRVLGFSSAVSQALHSIKVLSVAPLKMLKDRKFEGISGPLGIAQRTAIAWEEGPAAIFLCMAMISVGLGLINLFPIPVLDGGMILLSIIEGIRGKPLSGKMQNAISFISIFGLLGMFIYFSWKDLIRIL